MFKIQMFFATPFFALSQLFGWIGCLIIGAEFDMTYEEIEDGDDEG